MARKWWTLVGACSGLFVLMLDSTVVALALTSIRHDIGASSAGLQWVMNGYLLVIAAFVVTAGRLGDIFGRKRLFIAGMATFALGSVLSGAANDEHVLIAGRVLQGLGAAPMLPLSLAIVCNAFPAEEQARALGIWAGISALALGIGPLAGGALVELDWRAIFWINLPIVAIGVAITAWAAPESRDPNSARRVDLPGLVTLAVGLTAVVLALVQARAWGAGTVVPVALVAVASLYAFWRIEHRVSEPIVDFSLFRNGPYFGASAAAFALVGAYWCVMFFQPQYLQDVRGHSAILSGLLILPVTVPMIFVSPFSGRLIARFGARGLMTSGMVCGTVGLLVLTRLAPDTSYWALLAGLPALWGSPGPGLRADVDRRDGGDAGGEGGHRLGGAGDGPGDGGRLLPRRRRRRLSRAAGERRLLRGRDRRLDLVPGRPLCRRHRSNLGFRPRCRAAGTRSGGRRRPPAGGAPQAHPSPPLSPLGRPDRIPERFLAS